MFHPPVVLLRKSPGYDSCPSIPPFSFKPRREKIFKPNPFLIILNAQIKFRRYLGQIPKSEIPLPNNVYHPINRTMELVDFVTLGAHSKAWHTCSKNSRRSPGRRGRARQDGRKRGVEDVGTLDIQFSFSKNQVYVFRIPEAQVRTFRYSKVRTVHLASTPHCKSCHEKKSPGR